MSKQKITTKIKDNYEVETPDLTKAGEFQKLLVNFSLDQFMGLAEIFEIPTTIETGEQRRDFHNIENTMADYFLNLNSKDKKKVLKNMKKIVEANMKNGVD